MENLFRTNKKFNSILSSESSNFVWREGCLKYFQGRNEMHLCKETFKKMRDKNRRKPIKFKFEHIEWAKKECKGDWKW
jgi:hypothetical protein